MKINSWQETSEGIQASVSYRREDRRGKEYGEELHSTAVYWNGVWWDLSTGREFHPWTCLEDERRRRHLIGIFGES